MCHYAFFLLVTLGSFSGYCWALIDWVQDYKTGVYALDRWEAFYESSLLIIYSILAVRFLIKNLIISKER
jgi:hypothetical protein